MSVMSRAQAPRSPRVCAESRLAISNTGISKRRHSSCHHRWPERRLRESAEALRPLLILHSIRFIGLAMLVPGFVSPGLPLAFALPAAYGDIVAAILRCFRCY